MEVSHIDHFVLTVSDVERTCEFYTRVLGFKREEEPGKPTALLFGRCKLNVHACNRTFEPKAKTPTPGSADFCVITTTSIASAASHLRKQGIAIEQGPVERNGARDACSRCTSATRTATWLKSAAMKTTSSK